MYYGYSTSDDFLHDTLHHNQQKPVDSYRQKALTVIQYSSPGNGLRIFIYCLQRDRNMSSDLSITELVKRIKDYLKNALSDLEIAADHEGANVVVRVYYHKTTGGVTQVMNLNDQQKREIKVVANKLIQEFRLAIKAILDHGTQMICRFCTN
jgi:hypothetical protein